MGGPVRLSHPAAIAILTVLYGLVLGYGICLPMQSRLEDRTREAQG